MRNQECILNGLRIYPALEGALMVVRIVPLIVHLAEQRKQIKHHVTIAELIPRMRILKC